MDINILNELVNGILEIMKSSLVQIVLYGSVREERIQKNQMWMLHC